MNLDVEIPEYKIRAELCKRSFFEFVQDFWHEIIPEEPVWNWHIEFICDELQKVTPNLIGRNPKEYDLLINVPPGSTKSTIVTIMYPAWLWAKDPTMRIINNSYSGDIAIDHAVKSRDVITSDKYIKFFPDVKMRKDMSGKQQYQNTEGGERITASTGSKVTGRHAHLILNDDPQAPEQAESDVYRKLAINQEKTLSSRKVDKDSSLTVTVMQRLHQEDVSGYLMEIKGDHIRHIKLPAELTDKQKPKPEEVIKKYKENDGLLDPKRLGKRAIEEAKKDLGSRAFSGQWMQNPVSEGGDIIKENWFGYIEKNEFLKLCAQQKEEITVHFFADTAYTEKTENDPSGIIAACKVGGYVYITAAKKVFFEFPDLVRFIPVFAYSNGYDKNSTIRIEPKSSGKGVVQMLREQTQLNVVEIPSPMDSKLTRLHSQSAVVEGGRVILVGGSWNSEFVQEVSGFPNMKHDEYVDVLVYALNHLLTMGEQISKTTKSLAELGIAY